MPGTVGAGQADGLAAAYLQIDVTKGPEDIALGLLSANHPLLEAGRPPVVTREPLADPAGIDEDLALHGCRRAHGTRPLRRRHSSSAKSADRRRKSQIPAARKIAAVMALIPSACT